jgi:sucrose phosphorylase
MEGIKQLLHRIYGQKKDDQAFEKILALIENFPKMKSETDEFFSQEDVVLITYGDSLLKANELSIRALQNFALNHLKGAISTIHFLPFFPFSSDDGFSVMDFYAINPELGSWDDVTAIEQDFRLMFDYVVNHFSSKMVFRISPLKQTHRQIYRRLPGHGRCRC